MLNKKLRTTIASLLTAVSLLFYTLPLEARPAEDMVGGVKNTNTMPASREAWQPASQRILFDLPAPEQSGAAPTLLPTGETVNQPGPTLAATATPGGSTAGLEITISGAGNPAYKNTPITATRPTGGLTQDIDTLGSLPFAEIRCDGATAQKLQDFISNAKDDALTLLGVTIAADTVVFTVGATRATPQNLAQFQEFVRQAEAIAGPIEIFFTKPPTAGAAGEHRIVEGVHQIWLGLKYNNFIGAHEVGHAITSGLRPEMAKLGELKDAFQTYVTNFGLARQSEIEANQIAYEFCKSVGDWPGAIAAKTMQIAERLYLMPIAKAIQYTVLKYATPLATAGMLGWMATNLTGSTGRDRDGDILMSSGGYFDQDIANTIQSLQCPTDTSKTYTPVVIPSLERVSGQMGLNVTLVRADGSSVQVNSGNSYEVKHEVRQAGIQAVTLTRDGNNIYIHPAPPAH